VIPATAREVQLVARPDGVPDERALRVVEAPVRAPADGQFTVRNVLWGVDPWQRVYMTETRAANRDAFALGRALPGDAVGRVVASRHPEFAVGDWVAHRRGWREYQTLDHRGALRVDPRRAPVSTALGVLGLAGFTGWYGMRELGRPQPGETVYVSSAAGTVGSLAAQLAAQAGAHVVASAGSAAKLDWLRTLGLSDVFDHTAAPVADNVARCAPGGLDLYFDNVGGDHLEAALDAMREHGRVLVCGGVSGYNDPALAAGPRNLHVVYQRSLRLIGFRQGDRPDLFERFADEVAHAIAAGRIGYREHVLDGVDAAPRAFVELFEARPIGTLLVRVAHDDQEETA
jgi:NADPH-dependent curcumin reductase CurA